MTVNNYLSNLGSKLVLKNDENEKIKTSINNLENKLNYYFTNINDQNIEDNFMFGSYTRGTILPRKVDEDSDIDYIVVFKNPNNYKPDTLLRWLRNFVNRYYSSSEIYQSHPTIVLELNHIKFELVPAYNENSWLSYMISGTTPSYKIPAPASDYMDWMSTDPIKFKSELTDKNTQNASLIKPAIRLLKYWNVLNGKIYSSYQLEEIAINQSYWNFNLTYIVNVIIQALPTHGLTYKKCIKVETLQRDMKSVYEDKESYPMLAENNVKKIFPDI